MKADKNTLKAVKSYFENQEGWDLDEVISEIIDETQLLRHEEMGKYTLSADECNIHWGEESVCGLDDFIDLFTRIFIEKVCNVLESFEDEDLSYYELEED